MKAPYPLVVLACLAAGTIAGCVGDRAVDRCASGGCTDDERLAAEVEARLSQHPELRPPNLVYVRAHDGVVYLSGLVSTELQRDIAVDAARQAPGERRVLNDIGLEYTGR